MNSIALDQDLLRIAIENHLPIFLRTSKKPKYKLGEELIVKETWRETPTGYELMLDNKNKGGGWAFSNLMPIILAKRKAKVVLIEEISEKKYSTLDIHEIMYNNRIYGIKDCPDDRWFRTKIVPKPIHGKAFITAFSISNLDQDSIPLCEKSNIIHFVPTQYREE